MQGVVVAGCCSAAVEVQGRLGGWTDHLEEGPKATPKMG